jgi:hypothetical protein
VKSTVFRDIKSRSPLQVNRRLGGTYRLHIQGRGISRARNRRENRWQTKQRCPSETNGLHGVLSQKLGTLQNYTAQYKTRCNMSQSHCCHDLTVIMIQLLPLSPVCSDSMFWHDTIVLIIHLFSRPHCPNELVPFQQGTGNKVAWTRPRARFKASKPPPPLLASSCTIMRNLVESDSTVWQFIKKKYANKTSTRSPLQR